MASTTISNPPGYLNMTDYKSVIGRYNGPAKIQRFVANIPSLPAQLQSKHSAINKDLMYLCEATEYPGRGFMNLDTRYYGPNFKVPYQTTYEDLNLTFVVRDYFLERELFDDWMELINPTSTYDFSYRKDYQCKIELFQMSEVSTREGTLTAQYKFTFLNAWPILVNPMPVNWAEDNFHRLTIAFTFTRWTRESLDPVAPPQFSLTPNGTVIDATKFTGEPTFGTPAI